MSFFSSKKDSVDFSDFSEEDFEKIKFKARIALVDDEEITYVNRLKQDGYNIADFHDIENIDEFIRKKYDVVILDIQGIGKHIAENTEGWGILKYLKTECPNIVVLIFTGADWSITKYKAQADLADDFIGKDLEFLDFKSKIDSAIRKAFSYKFHFEIFKQKISKEVVNANTLKEIEEIVKRNNNNKDKALREARKVVNKSEVLNHLDTFLSISSHIADLLS